jgi:hypothetical protein
MSIDQKAEWRRVTVEKAREVQDTQFIWWRPEMTNASRNSPDKDPAYILDTNKDYKV